MRLFLKLCFSHCSGDQTHGIPELVTDTGTLRFCHNPDTGGFCGDGVADVVSGDDADFSTAEFEQQLCAYVCELCVPVLLLMLTVGGTLISGFTSRFTGVEDQEWWARSGAWILMSVAAWCIFNAIVLFGPSLFVELQAQLMQNKDLTWSSAKGLGTMLIGAVSGAITLFGGFSTKTSANGEPADQSGVKSKLPSIATTVAAIIFGTFIAIVLALITDWILASSLGNWGSLRLGSGPLTLNANDRERFFISRRVGC